MSNFLLLFIFYRIGNRPSRIDGGGGDRQTASANERKDSTGQETFPSMQRRFLL